jgi:hypothetical protein
MAVDELSTSYHPAPAVAGAMLTLPPCETAEDAEADCVVVPLASGKAVKDVLKASGWLNPCVRPTTITIETPAVAAAPDGLDVAAAEAEVAVTVERRLALPLVRGSSEAVRRAVSAGALPPLQAVITIERIGGLAPAKRPPAQGRKAAAAAAGAGAGVRRPPQSGGRRPAPQHRSFGRGRRGRAADATLPAARPVRRLQCPPHADCQRWLREEVWAGGEPAVLQGLPLGPVRAVLQWRPFLSARAMHTPSVWATGSLCGKPLLPWPPLTRSLRRWLVGWPACIGSVLAAGGARPGCGAHAAQRRR